MYDIIIIIVIIIHTIILNTYTGFSSSGPAETLSGFSGSGPYTGTGTGTGTGSSSTRSVLKPVSVSIVESTSIDGIPNPRDPVAGYVIAYIVCTSTMLYTIYSLFTCIYIYCLLFLICTCVCLIYI